MSKANRRAFLRKSTAMVGAAALAGPFQGLLARAGGVVAGNSGVNNHAGYGDLVDAMDRTTGQYLLRLPQGFEYRTFGAAGELMDDGYVTPPSHDGMMAFNGPNGSIRLVRNHETTFQMGNNGGPFTRFTPQPAAGEVGPNPYDAVCTGGTTTIEIGRDGNDWGPVRSWRSASGTYFNCSGGDTSYGTWITCEELTSGPEMTGPPWRGDFFGNAANLNRPHGYIYEVDPAWGPGEAPTPVPITRAGRFTHEGAVMDNATGHLYMTQDDFFGPSGLYRYIPPNDPRRDKRIEDGGILQMLRVPAMPRAELFRHQAPGTSFAVDWVTIPDPDPSYAAGASWLSSLGDVSRQGIDQGAAQFSRLEGIRRRGRQIFFSSTQGGQGREGVSSTFGPGYGQIWQLNLATMTLHLVFEAPPPAPGPVGPVENLPALSLPDNIAISPRGILVLCEDGTVNRPSPPVTIPSNFLRGLTKGGALFDFAQNIEGTGEFTGATFSPDGKRLFFNIQDIGRTFEVRGPFERGPF